MAISLLEWWKRREEETITTIQCSASAASPDQSYRKHHLVPFGEFIPLKFVFGWVINVLRIPLSDFSRGGLDQQPMHLAGQKVAVNICYEDVFGEEIIKQLPEATLLANVSNDAWFGRSIGPRQHLQISQMRALETGRYMLRATNTGVTAIINERGSRVAGSGDIHHNRLAWSGARDIPAQRPMSGSAIASCWRSLACYCLSPCCPGFAVNGKKR